MHPFFGGVLIETRDFANVIRVIGMRRTRANFFPGVFSVADPQFSAHFGFSEDEISTLMEKVTHCQIFYAGTVGIKYCR